MSGHNKWSQIKRQKGVTDAKKSKIFSKYVRLLGVEAKKAKGNLSSPSLKTAIEKARAANVPGDTIERAIKKAANNTDAQMEALLYEAYGPGGCAIIINTLTDNKNRTSQEIKHILLIYGATLANTGSATWAFEKINSEWKPKITMSLGDADIQTLDTLVDSLEENDDVQEVITNVE